MLMRFEVPAKEHAVQEAPMGKFAGAVKVPTKELSIRVALRGLYAGAVSGSCK